MSKFLNSATQPFIIYIFGPDSSDKDPEERILVKIGKSDNTPSSFNQRLAEHQRHCPRDIELAAFPSISSQDSKVRHYLCKTYPSQFKQIKTQRGHEVVELRVKDYALLIEQATRFLNGTNTGNTHLANFADRQEQTDCLDKTAAFFSNPDNLHREFLWDAKMRFGKTYTAYRLISRQEYKTILILTGRPTDTKKAWIKGMDHVAFSFGPDNFIDASEQTQAIQLIENDITIIFASLQDLNLDKKKFSLFPTFNFDLIIKDECHLAFDTDRTKEILSKLNYQHSLNLSGTAFRALLMERFPEDAIFSWSYVEEQKARQQEIQNLTEQVAKESGQYYWLAPMKVFTILLSESLYKDAELFTEYEGFTFTKLFTTVKDGFLHDTSVDSFLNTISHGLHMPYSPQAQEQYQSINLKHTLWYVPGVHEAILLAEKMRRHSIFKHYKIIVAAGDTNDGAGRDTVGNTERAIDDIENGWDNRHIGTITITCGKLSHGVSIPQWGAVFCLSDMQSAALYFQLIFRCQTEWKGIKEECYVFDFNPNRTLNYFNDLANVRAKTGNIRETLAEQLNVFNVLCYEDNAFTQLDANDVIAKLSKEFGRPNAFSTLQRIFDNLHIEMDSELLNELANIEDGLSVKANTIQLNEHNEVPNGKNTRGSIQEGDDDLDLEMGEVEEDDKGQKVSATEQQQVRARLAAKQLPTLISLLSADSYDELVSALETDRSKKLCRKMTGISTAQMRKILANVPSTEQQRINRCLTAIRTNENKSHQQYQDELSGE